MSETAIRGDGETGSAALEGQVFEGGSLTARYASFVKLPHTLFALPFAGVGVILASYDYADRITVGRVLWVLVAFTAARFAAMGFNRIVDRRYDALNPRTARRELPAGRLNATQATAAVFVAAALFVFASWQLNPLCGMLSPLALSWIFFYSYTKRFTSWSHNVLGFALGIAPVGAYLAIAGEWTRPWYALVILASAVMFWVAGFDVIYALQDVEFDRAHRLHSLPANKGERKALLLARVFHMNAIAFFLVVAVLNPFPVGWLYLCGVAVAGVLLGYEHWLLRGDSFRRLDLLRIDRAFFRVNVVVSITIFAFTLADRLVLA